MVVLHAVTIIGLGTALKRIANLEEKASTLSWIVISWGLALSGLTLASLEIGRVGDPAGAIIGNLIKVEVRVLLHLHG